MKRRSLAKAISWRVVGTLSTFVISLIVTGEIGVAGAIASVEVFTKTAFFFAHERVWENVNWGKV